MLPGACLCVWGARLSADLPGVQEGGRLLAPPCVPGFIPRRADSLEGRAPLPAPS